MQDVIHPSTDKLVKEFLERAFPDSPRTILGGIHLDIRRPNLHDSKDEFLEELRFVKRSATDLFALYRGLNNQGDASLQTARGLHMDFHMQAFERNKTSKPKTAVDLVLDSARRVDYWGVTKRSVFELYLNFSNRLKTLEEQKEIFWSTHGRPPDHYARVMALRLAKLYVAQKFKIPTSGTARDGDYPSTEYCRLLQELFEILGIKTDFRLPSEWAVMQLKDSDHPVPEPPRTILLGNGPNLGRWGGRK